MKLLHMRPNNSLLNKLIPFYDCGHIFLNTSVINNCPLIQSFGRVIFRNEPFCEVAVFVVFLNSSINFGKILFFRQEAILSLPNYLPHPFIIINLF